MPTTRLLRAASILSLLIAAGHSLGGLKKWSPMGANEVLNAMGSVRFQAMGVSRSYLDFYLGFGWSLSVAMLMQAALLWQLASLARTNGPQVRAMIVVFALAALATAVISWRMILPLPAVLSALLLLLLVWARISCPARHGIER
jgi:hypothetical protein